MTYDTLYVGGSFDILHDDHRMFIRNCIDAYSARFGRPSKIIIGLGPDNHLNSKKGSNRPFFSFEWRSEDMRDFLKGLDINFDVIDASLLYSGHIDKSRTVLAVRLDNTEHGKKVTDMGFKVMYVPSIDRHHTSDIERMLIIAKAKSNCKLRKVGALLVRDGEIIKDGFSGDGDCESCSKYKVFLTGRSSRDTPCDYPHAEIVCLEDAKEGDDLLITTSPCMSCAEMIISKKIRRVVFLEEYHDLKPLELLRENGVLINKCGLKEITSQKRM